jgi:hypothetical protein
MFWKVAISILYLIFIFAFEIHAEDMVRVVAYGECVLGENDSKASAKKIAREDAWRKALEKIGIYFETEQHTNTGKLTKDEIRIFTGSIIETNLISEDYEILANKTIIYKIKIEALVDKSLLFERLKEAKYNSKQSETAKLLMDENQRLWEVINKLTEDLNTSNSKSIIPILSKRQEAFNSYEKNKDVMKKVFSDTYLPEKINYKIKELDNYKQMTEESIKELDWAFQYMKSNIQLTVSDPKVISVYYGKKTGQRYAKLEYNITADMENEAIDYLARLLSKNFSLKIYPLDDPREYELNKKGTIHVKNLENQDENIDESYKLLCDYFKNKNIYIISTLGDKSKIIRLKYNDIIKTHIEKKVQVKILVSVAEKVREIKSEIIIGDPPEDRGGPYGRRTAGPSRLPGTPIRKDTGMHRIE